MLLHAIVEGALDRSPIGVGSLGQPRPRRSKLCYLTLQLVNKLTESLVRADIRHSLTSPACTSPVKAPIAQRRRGRIVGDDGSRAHSRLATPYRGGANPRRVAVLMSAGRFGVASGEATGLQPPGSATCRTESLPTTP